MDSKGLGSTIHKADAFEESAREAREGLLRMVNGHLDALADDDGWMDAVQEFLLLSNERARTLVDELFDFGMGTEELAAMEQDTFEDILWEAMRIRFAARIADLEATASQHSG